MGGLRRIAGSGVLAAALALHAPGGAYAHIDEPPPGSAPRVVTIVVDPGHDRYANLARERIGPGSSIFKIKDGGGTSGVVTGQREAAFNLRVGLRLRTLLRATPGIRVVMTRTRTCCVSMGNIARARIANRAHAALFLRIHADGSTNHGTRGTSTLYPAVHTGWTDDIAGRSKRAARFVQRRLVRALGFPDRGLVPRSDITGFNWSNVPVILVEVGFLTNPTEDRELATAAKTNTAARALRKGVLDYLRDRGLR